MAEQMALTTPSQIDVINSLRLSTPQKAKNFFQCLEHYATSPVVFDADVGLPHGLIKGAGRKKLRLRAGRFDLALIGQTMI